MSICNRDGKIKWSLLGCQVAISCLNCKGGSGLYSHSLFMLLNFKTLIWLAVVFYVFVEVYDASSPCLMV